MQTVEFGIECNEKGGVIVRRIKLFERTVPNMVAVVDRLKDVPNFLNQTDPFQVFFREDTTFFEVDDVGMLAVADMQYGWSASVHITFWDRRLRGREELCRRMAEWIISIAKLRFVWTVIPKSAEATLAFCKRVGFEVVKEENGVVALQLNRRA